ncbi:MAG: mechanosensitive ion channel protein MscS [Flavobacteriaceae bacterium]|nr:mechanosensitive ion channel protein MscS [Flavobacteriaceae bacterium]
MNSLNLKTLLSRIFEENGITKFWAENLSIVILFFFTIILSIILFWVTRRIIINIFNKSATRTESKFDDLLLKNRVPRLLSYIPLLFFIYANFPGLFETIYKPFTYGLKIIIEALSVIIALGLIRALLKSLSDFLKTFPALKEKPLDSYLQVIMIFLWFIGGVLILSILTGKDVWSFVTALGALSAVLLFVFKDTILGFVASVQVAVNDTVRIGDWISMPQNKADGDVISVSLSTVQVQNFDKTITSIPTYKLISESFINWRGMSESDGRRIKRSLLIKISSIRFLESSEIQELKKIELLSEILEKRNEEIDKSNSNKKVDKSLLINGRNFTNLGLFRFYTEAYLENHPMINTDMTIMCRQLPPTAQGIPLEVYVFTKVKEWINYEHISADIFDHLLASIKYFSLECFELNSNFLPNK